MAEGEGQMNERQVFALANPLNDPDLSNPQTLQLMMQLSEYRALHGGNTLCVVIAINR
jgi:hypothetical protein